MKVSVSCIVRCDEIVRCLSRLPGTVHNPSNDFCAVVVVVVVVVLFVLLSVCLFVFLLCCLRRGNNNTFIDFSEQMRALFS